MKLKNLLNLTGDHLYTLPLMVLYLTDGCNSRCVTCDIWRNPRRNMPMKLVDSLVSAAVDLQTRWVLLSGGEAMQHPQWPQIAQRFRKAGVRVMLLTNGLLLRKQIDAVLESVDDVIVILDGGNAQTYEAIRGVDAFDLIMDGVRALTDAGMPVTTRTTVQKANYQEMPQIIDVALAAGVQQVSFLAVDVSNPFAFGDRAELGDIGLPIAHMGPGAAPDHGPSAQLLDAVDLAHLSTLLDEITLDYADQFAQGRIAESPAKLRRILLRYFEAQAGKGQFEAPRCNAPHFSTVIDVDGSLRPCYFLPTYGRLTPDGPGLGQAINQDAGQALRQAYRQGKRAECGTCVCPLYKGPRDLVRM